MARRFTPPTPIRGPRAQRERVEAIRKQRAESRGVRQAKRARKAQLTGDAFSQAHSLLERETFIPWRKARVRSGLSYWDERWDFSATRARVAYEEIHEWMVQLQLNRTVASYLGSRTVSFLIMVDDDGEILTFTAAAAGDFLRAMDEMDEKLQIWAEGYGRDQDESGYSRVLEVVVFLRRRGVHPDWRQVVKGRATAREDKRLPPGSDF